MYLQNLIAPVGHREWTKRWYNQFSRDVSLKLIGVVPIVVVSMYIGMLNFSDFQFAKKVPLLSNSIKLKWF